MMNKKGDVTISTIILIVLGLAVLVFLVIGLTQGWDVFFGNLGKVDPGDLQVVAKACTGYAEAGLSISFCEFKEIDTGGDDEYVNCIDGRILPLVRAEVSSTLPTCTGTNSAATFCLRGGKIRGEKLTVTKVNSKTCSDIGVSSAECTPKDGSKVPTNLPCVCSVNANNGNVVNCNAGQICKSDGTCEDITSCPNTAATLACECKKSDTQKIICDKGKTCVTSGAGPVCN